MWETDHFLTSGKDPDLACFGAELAGLAACLLFPPPPLSFPSDLFSIPQVAQKTLQPDKCPKDSTPSSLILSGMNVVSPVCSQHAHCLTPNGNKGQEIYPAPSAPLPWHDQGATQLEMPASYNLSPTSTCPS